MATNTFHLRGEYDLSNASELETDLLRFAHSDGGGPLTIDATHLRFIDSTGIGVLVRVSEVLRSERRTIRCVNLPESARRVVDVLSLQDVLGVVDDS